MKRHEVHFIYGGQAASTWIYKIAKSNKQGYLLFYQPFNVNDNLQEPNIKRLPDWVKIKIELNFNIIYLLPSFIYISFILLNYRKSRIVCHMSSCLTPLIASLFLGIEERIYFSHGFANIDADGPSFYLFSIIETLNIITSTKTINVSPPQCQLIIKYPFINSNKIYPIYPGSCCGIDRKHIIRDKDLDFKIKLLEDMKNITISYIGRPYKRKGYPYILEIFESLNEYMMNNENQIKLQIIGIPYQLVYDYISNKNYKNKIEIIEYTKNVFKYLEKSSIVILPSIHEGFGYALLEGAACGNALACFDITGPNCLVQNGYNGITIPKGSSPREFASSLYYLIKKKYLLKSMMRNSRLSATKFESSIVINSIRKILK